MVIDLHQRNGKRSVNRLGVPSRPFRTPPAGPSIAVMEDQAALPSEFESEAILLAVEQSRLPKPVVFTPGEVDLLLAGEEKPVVLIDGKLFEPPDVVLVRTGAGTTEFAFRVLDALLIQGTRIVNSPESTALCADKWRCLHVLSAAGLPVPRTWLAHRCSRRQLDRVAKWLGFPCVLKPRSGAQGNGVTLVADERELRAALEKQPSGTHLVQEYLSHSRGKDLRVIVVGGLPVAACCRVSRGDEWRSNCTLGADAIPAPLNSEMAKLAVLAARCLGCEICGVDLLFRTDAHL